MVTSPTNFKGLDKSLRMQKIVEAATRLFHKKGFKATTLEEVAGALNLSKAALYHYIPGKGKLLSIIYNQAFEKIFHRIYTISAQEISPAEKLRQLIRDHICNIITSNIAMFSVFFAEENQLPSRDFQEIRQKKIKYSRLVREIVDEGIAAGVFKPVDSRLLVNAILGMCNWIYQWYRPEKEAFSPEQIADQFIGLLEAGYLERRPVSQAAAAPQTFTEFKLLSEQLAALVARLEALVT